MRITFAFAAGAAGLALLAAGHAFAAGYGGAGVHGIRRHLPPVSGTIRLERGAFGAGQPSSVTDGRFTSPRFVPAGRFYRGGTSRRFAAASPYGYGPALGVQSHAYAQLADQGAGYGRFDADGGYGVERRPPHRSWWQGDGTGLVGLVGAEDDGIGVGLGGYGGYGVQTGWGTADSASTGGAYPLPSPAYPSRSYHPSRSYQAETPLDVRYGEPAILASYDGGAGSVAPTGGLAYYNSGSPGRMGYYGSSSSAGPGGSPGGLGFYSSGSFGSGPGIIHVGSRHRGGRGLLGQTCFCGPHIIHVGRGRRIARD